MGLKQDIVIRNEFTVKTSTGGGTRGATPGDYVLRYMSRLGATEDLTPIRHDIEDFTLRYMARDSAVDVARSVSDLKDNMREIQGDGGVAFGYGDFSLSDTHLKMAAKDIQVNFDKGKTVLKTVLSFDEAYLKKHGIVEPDFVLKKEGDYRGNIDQMKLRMAIMNGLDKMSKYYDDLQYIGVIQVDTKHVHCHLAMVDRGVGNVYPNGQQNGKLSVRARRDLRRGIDMFLDEKQTVKMMASSVSYDKRNTVCFVKKFTHQMMDERGFSQFLLACLPDDRRLWRASTNRKEMQKPNAIVREYVTELLKQPNSGYQDALRRIDAYAKSRQSNEDLIGKEYRQLYNQGKERLISECMNGVYSILKQIPEYEMNVRTPMIETMALPYDVMASEVESDPMIEFGFKLRSYKSRLDYHTKEMHKYHDAARNYRQQQDTGNVDETSKPLLDFFEKEEDYHLALMSKYQHFLNFIPPTSTYQKEFDELLNYQKRVDNMARLYTDKSIKRMKPDNAEEYGKKVYGLSGGRYMPQTPGIIEGRLAKMQEKYDDMESEFITNLADYGMYLDDDMTIKHDTPYNFDEVKAFDLHHLLYDFPYNFEVSKSNVDAFVAITDSRYQSFMLAKDYLVRSGQEEMLEIFPESDILLQRSFANRFRMDNVMYTKRDTSKETRKATHTVRIDYDFYVEQENEIKNMIKETINSLQYE